MQDKKWIINQNGTLTCPDCKRTYEEGSLPSDFVDPKRDRCNWCDARVVEWAHRS